jgi:hypothetical protein
MIIPPVPRAEPRSRSLERFCAQPSFASLDQGVHFRQYLSATPPYHPTPVLFVSPAVSVSCRPNQNTTINY